MDLSPLSKISAEIRVQIYQHTVVSTVPIILCPPSSIRISQAKQKSSQLPGLLHTCRQLRHETLQLYYASNAFEFRCNIWSHSCNPKDYIDRIHEWLDMLGVENCRVVHSIVVNLGQYSEDVGRLYPWPRYDEWFVRRVYTIAPYMAFLISRVGLEVFSISSTWTMKHQSTGIEAYMEASLFRLFYQDRALLLSLDPCIKQNTVHNTKIECIFGAILVGKARGIFILLMNAIWLYCRSCGIATEEDLRECRRLLSTAFQRNDDRATRRIISILPEGFRGYEIGKEVLNEAWSSNE